jgi:hypothetical protein
VTTQQDIKEALILLEQMSQYPNEILQVMNEGEQAELMQELNALAARAIVAQSSADLPGLVNAIRQLVEDRAALRHLFLSDGTNVEREQVLRGVTLADQQAIAGLNAYTQQFVPQIRNTVIDCQIQMQAALDKQAALQQEPIQRKSHDRTE